MGIGVKYDDGNGSMRPLASYKGMSSPWGSTGRIGSFAKGMAGTSPARKSLIDKMRERRELGKEASKSIKLDVADPRRQGKVIGAVKHHGLDVDDSHREATSHEPWERPFMSGLHFEEEAPTGRIIVWAYLRTDRFTGEGRAFETTGETRVPVFSFYPGEEGEGLNLFKLSKGEDGNTIVGKGAYFVARRFVRVPNATDLGDLSEFTGYIILRYSLGGDTATVVKAGIVATPSTTSCDYPLYHVTNGVVDEDYRGAPHVQVRE